MAQQKKESGEMKKLIAIVAVAVMVLSLGTVAAFAADQDFPFDELKTTQSAVNVTADEDDAVGHTIPVYGYVGPLGKVKEENEGDEGNKDVSPIVTPINVSVPTKLFWAAFESDKGNITAPKYKIENGADYDVNVVLTSFTNANGNASDNDYVDKYLDLNLVNDGSTTVFGSNGTAVVKKGNVADYLGDDTDEDVTLGKLSSKSAWNFSFGGEFKGDFPDTTWTPKYTMVLTFSIHKDVA
jgi:hypothetical protein